MMWVWLSAAGGLLLLVVIIGWAWRRSSAYDGRLVTDGVAALAAADSWRGQAELELHLPKRRRGRQRPLTEIAARLEGVVVRGAERQAEFGGTFTTEARGRGSAFTAAGDVRLLPEVTLFYLRDFPVLLNPSGSLLEAWTRVSVPLLAVTNGVQVHEALAAAAAELSFAGVTQEGGEKLAQFRGTLSEETAVRLADTLGRATSGSPALDVVARLLAANRADVVEVWVAPKGRQLRRVRAHFVRLLADGSSFDFATLTLTASDFNAAAAVDRPEARLSVKPEVFAQLFGGGEVKKIEE